MTFYSLLSTLFYSLCKSRGHLLPRYSTPPLLSMTMCFFLTANQRVAVDFNRWSIAEVGLPDGMTIDMDGKLWVAGYLSSKVMQFDPTNG